MAPPSQDKGKGKANEYVEAYKRCVFAQTRWPHTPTLVKLGLLEDVTAILTNIGLQDILEMNHLAYPEALAHMMGTIELEFEHKYPPPPIEELGKITFMVKGKKYELTIKDLCAAYGFKPSYGGKVQYLTRSDAKAWKWLSYAKYKNGFLKSSTIRNPAVRYVHHIIANTMYAREETSKVKQDEFALLLNGLFPITRPSFAKERIGEYSDLNLGVMLAKHLVRLKSDWILHKPVGAKVYIGGFLTPILRACKVPLGKPTSQKQRYLDQKCLMKRKFLDCHITDGSRYMFISGYRKSSWVDLPNRSITSLLGVEHAFDNLRFMHDCAVEEESIPQSTKPRISQNLPLGSARYYHAPYAGKVSTKSIQHALEGVAKNQRHGKWLARSLHNVTKEIKEVKSKMSDLTAIVKTFVLERRTPPRNNDGTTSYEAVLAEARKYTTSHSSRGVDMDKGESSRDLLQGKRKRRRIPTPSPPTSDNELIHFSDSDSEE